MKLRKLRIENFRAIKALELSLDDALGRIRPITVVAGPNGCGKTSVLFAIVQALRGVMGYRTSDVPEPNEMDIHRAWESNMWSPMPLPASVQLDLKLEPCEIAAIRLVFRDTQSLRKNQVVPALPELSDGRIEIEWEYPPARKPDGTRMPYSFLKNARPRNAMRWLQGRAYAIRGWNQHKLSNRDLMTQVGGIQMFPQDRNLCSRVMAPELETEERPDTDDILLGPEQARRAHNEPTLWGILDYLSKYARADRGEALPDELNWEKRIQRNFKSVCSPKEYVGFLYRRDDPLGAPCLKHNDAIYPISHAASGEMVILDYITRLTYPSPMNHSLVLIDEPEIHLHPGWVRQLYLQLPQIGTDNQYLLTTHSLELRKIAAQDNALVDMGEL